MFHRTGRQIASLLLPKSNLWFLLLAYYNLSFDIIVALDASDYSLGAVISYIFLNNCQKAIAHVSRSLTSAEWNYSLIEK